MDYHNMDYHYHNMITDAVTVISYNPYYHLIIWGLTESSADLSVSHVPCDFPGGRFWLGYGRQAARVTSAHRR